MRGPDFLVVELCRGGKIKKHVIADVGIHDRLTVGERQIRVAAGLMARNAELRAGDRVNVPLPIEWDEPPCAGQGRLRRP
jgi:hypothetical protein